MAFSKSHVAILVLCLAVFASPAAAFSFRNLMTVVASFGSACLTPASQDTLPVEAGPYDTDSDPLASKYYCFGFQFTSTHEPSVVAAVIKGDWFKNIGNPLVNPMSLLGTSDEEPAFEDVQKNSVMYYPLDGALGSGTGGKGYGGSPYLVNTVSGPYTYSVAYQVEGFNEGVTTAKINKALRNLGKRILRFFPVRFASNRRPGVTNFEITTYWVRQDPSVNSATRTYNITIDGLPSQDRRPKGCQYV